MLADLRRRKGGEESRWRENEREDRAFQWRDWVIDVKWKSVWYLFLLIILMPYMFPRSIYVMWLASLVMSKQLGRVNNDASHFLLVWVFINQLLAQIFQLINIDMSTNTHLQLEFILMSFLSIVLFSITLTKK